MDWQVWSRSWGVGKIGSVVATNLFPALNPDALCGSQPQQSILLLVENGLAPLVFSCALLVQILLHGNHQLLFFRSGDSGLFAPFSIFAFSVGRMHPQFSPTATTPSPHIKNENYFLLITQILDMHPQVVDFIRHSWQLTNCWHIPFNTMSIMLSRNHKRYYKHSQTVTGNETSMGKCG